MENIGPVIFFLLYMVISAWAKRNKNQKLQERKEKLFEKEEESAPPPRSKVESFLEQLKRELMEEQEEVVPPPFMEPMQQEYEPPEGLEYIPVDYEPPEDLEFVEGSAGLDDLPDDHHLDHLDDIGVTSTTPKRSLGEILRPYSTVQQGILLHEILGKPRARQEDQDWFHSH